MTTVTTPIPIPSVETVDLGAIPFVLSMQKHGVLIDQGYLTALNTYLTELSYQAQEKAWVSVGKQFNVASPDQVMQLLYVDLHLPTPKKRTQKGFTTDRDALEDIQGLHPVVPLILEYRQVEKLRGTYVESLPKWADGVGRIHPDWKSTRTASGRLSCSEPNLQNIPIRSELGKKIRGAFIAESGYVILNADLSQIELRVEAHLANCKLWLGAFQRGEDIHAQTASQVFGVPLAQVTKDQRRFAKVVNFGLIYGMGDNTMADRSGFDLEQANRYIDQYWGRVPEIPVYMDEVRALARRFGYVEDVFGRRRYIPEANSTQKYVRLSGEREAINHPTQCVPANTRIRTTKGFERMGDFATGIVWTGAEWAYAYRIARGVGDLVRVRFDDGTSLTCDKAHYVLAYRGAWPSWVGVMDLIPGDAVPISNADRNDDGTKIETEEFWYWIGRYYGDGNLFHYNNGRKDHRHYVTWAFGGEKLDEVVNLVSFLENRGEQVSVHSSERRPSQLVAKVVSYTFDKRMLSLGITANQTAKTKRISDICFTLDRKRILALLRGYYDADGTRRRKRNGEWTPRQITSVNLGLMEDTALLVRLAGGRPFIKGPYGSNGQTPFYRLSIHGHKPCNPHCQHRELYRRVQEVTSLGASEPVFTVSVDNPHHAYDAEGVISRNSTAAGICKVAMGKLVGLGPNGRGRLDPLIWSGVVKPIIQVHDSLMFEVRKDAVDYVAGVVKGAMEESAPWMKCPTVADVEVGDRWSSLEPWKG